MAAVVLFSGVKPFKNVSNTSLTEEVQSLDIGNPEGATGNINFTVHYPGAEKETRRLLSKEFVYEDEGGTTGGVVSSVAVTDGELAVLTSLSILALLNVQRIIPPHDGSHRDCLIGIFDQTDPPEGVAQWSDIIDTTHSVALSNIAVPAHDANLWDAIKQYCSAWQAECVLIYDENSPVKCRVEFRDIRQFNIGIIDRGSVTVDYSHLPGYRFFDVQYTNAEWKVDGVAYGEETGFVLDANETQEHTFETDHTLLTVNQPRPVEDITPWPYKDPWPVGTTPTQKLGQYEVLNSRSTVVPPQDWIDGGGAVIVKINTFSPSSLDVTLRASRWEHDAPYTFQRDTAEETGSLFITGTGVFTYPKTVRVFTGTGQVRQGEDPEETVVNPYITNKEQAYDLGRIMARTQAQPVISLSMALPLGESTPRVGYSAGSRFIYNDQVYRIMASEFSYANVSIDAVADTTYNEYHDALGVNDTYADVDGSGLRYIDLQVSPLEEL